MSKGSLTIKTFSMLWLALALAPSLTHAAVLMSFNTSDGERIDGDLYSSQLNHSSVAIVAPGFAQHRQTPPMKKLCQDLSKTLDVVCLDLRGTGTSSGFYTFGEKEQLDLEAVLEWADVHYENVNLIGLSLGAYADGRAAYLWPKKVSKVLLISCPTNLDDIILSGGLFDSTYSSIINPGAPELQTGANWLGPGIFTRASFLIGEDDHLVFEKLSRKVYDSFAGEKTWDVFQNGAHAEAMLIQNAPAFEQWMVSHLQMRAAD